MTIQSQSRAEPTFSAPAAGPPGGPIGPASGELELRAQARAPARESRAAGAFSPGHLCARLRAEEPTLSQWSAPPLAWERQPIMSWPLAAPDTRSA